MPTWEDPAAYQMWTLDQANPVIGQGFPAGSVLKNPPASAGDLGSIPDPGRSVMPWSN